MKNAIRILCLLLCVVMCLGIVACAPEKAENEIPQASGDGATDGEGNKTEAPADDADVAFSTYELSLIDACVGTIVVNDYNAAGRLIRTNIKGDVDDYAGLVTMYMDHNYSDAGALTSSTVYKMEHSGVFEFTPMYKKFTTIDWTADDSGRIVSGMTRKSIDFWGDIDITYHGDTNVVDTVTMAELGEPDYTYTVKYDENGKKISEQYEDDILYTYTYESPTLTKVEMSYPTHNKTFPDTYTIEYDEGGRIIKTDLAQEEETPVTFSYTYVGNSDAVATFSLVQQEKNGWNEELNATFEYGEDKLLKGGVVEFKELLNGEVKELDVNDYTIQRDDRGRVTQVVFVESYDGAEQEKEVLTVEYTDSLSLKATKQFYYMDDESDSFKLANSVIYTYQYDENDNLLRRVTENLDAENTVYSTIKIEYEYDSRGNCIVKEQNETQNDYVFKLRNEYEYGEVPVLLKRTDYSYDRMSGEYAGKVVIEYEYYENLFLKKSTSNQYDKSDVAYRTLVEEYNSEGDRVKVSETSYQNGEKYGSNVTLYSYDSEGRRIKAENMVFDNNGELSSKLVDEYEYDQFDRQSKITTSRYDKDGVLYEKRIQENVRNEDDRLQYNSDCYYDGDGVLLRKITTAYTYDGDNMIQMIRVEYEGNDLVRKTVETHVYEDDEKIKIITDIYDADDNLISSTEITFGNEI